MKKYNEYLNETYVNLVGNDPKKKEYADEVWDVIQKSYAPIGGIAGSGFKSKDDMIKNIPFWKLRKKDGKITNVSMYKSKDGRKKVAMGTNGSMGAKISLAKNLDKELGRAYAEVSDNSWRFLKRALNKDFLLKKAIPVDKVKKMLKNKEIIDLEDIPEDDWNLGKDKSKHNIKKDDPFYKFYYHRKIGNTYHTKIMIGSPGLDIF